MAAFWLILASALCALYFAVDGETVHSDSDPGLAVHKPTETGPGTGHDDPSPTSTTTDPSTTNETTTDSPSIGTTILPGTTNKTVNRTDTTKPPAVNGTITPSKGNDTTIPPTTGTMPPTNGTKPPTSGTKPPSNETKPPNTEPTPPSTGTDSQSPGNPPSNPPSNPVPPVPMPQTGWIYPGLFWPPMQPQLSSYSSLDNFDEQMSGNAIILFFFYSNLFALQNLWDKILHRTVTL